MIFLYLHISCNTCLFGASLESELSSVTPRETGNISIVVVVQFLFLFYCFNYFETSGFLSAMRAYENRICHFLREKSKGNSFFSCVIGMEDTAKESLEHQRQGRAFHS